MAAFYFLVAIMVLIVGVIYYPVPKLSKNLIDWRENGKYYKYNEFNIFYRDVPGGEKNAGVLVLFHGFPTSSYDWIKVLPGIKSKFSRVILLDFLGYGFSGKPLDHSYTIGEQADIVEELMGHLQVLEIHILSHDYGDTVAAELLYRFNERKGKLRIRSLCLLNGGIFPDIYYPRPLQKGLLLPVVGPLLSYTMFSHAFNFGFSQIFGANTKPSAEDLNEFWASICDRDGHIVLHKLLQYIPERAENGYRWLNALKLTRIPVHMIYGPSDPVNPPPFADHYRSRLPGKSITVLDSAIGHYPQWEAPEETVKSYLEFIELIEHQNDKRVKIKL